MKNHDFRPYNFVLSRKITQYRVIVTMERQQELVCDLSNGVISNDLEWPRSPDFKVRPLFDAEYPRNG